METLSKQNQELLTVSVEDFSDVIYTNVVWNFIMARLAAVQMMEKHSGSIVFVNSNTAYRCIPEVYIGIEIINFNNLK